MQPVGTRSVARGPTNQDVGAPPPPGFPNTMLNVEKVKDNMWVAFIEKILTNRVIGTSMQTRYLRFKGMSYKNKSYSCALAVFNCGKLWLDFNVATCNLR